MSTKYFDNASTTRVAKQVLDEYLNATEKFYNPSALNVNSVEVKQDIEKVRENILKILNGKPKSKFIFTSCATESNNAVLRSCIKRKDKKHIITAGEHSSIYNTVKQMISEGYNIDICPLKEDGKVDEEILYNMVDDKTEFVSIIHVSNETGAINDIKTITKNLKRIKPDIIVHSDGVQALHKFDINLTDLGVDYYTISSHKINGIKGVAGLYIAPNVHFVPYIFGGGQEFGLRGGTENYPAIKSFEKAIMLPNMDYKKMEDLKSTLINSLNVAYKLISKEDNVPNIISIAFEGVRGETLLHMLDDLGFIVGTGSACNSKDTTNRVLNEMKVNKNLALGNIRISFEHDCETEDVISLSNAINECVSKYLQRTQK